MQRKRRVGERNVCRWEVEERSVMERGNAREADESGEADKR